MVQVRDNRKVCRLAVSMGVLALPNRCLGKSQQFGHRVQIPAGMCRRARTLRTVKTTRRPKIALGLTLNNTKSRQITENRASFSRIGHQPFAGADQVHQGKFRLIPVNPASQFFRLPKISPPLHPPSPPDKTSPASAGLPAGWSRRRPAIAPDRTQSHWIAVNQSRSNQFSALGSGATRLLPSIPDRVRCCPPTLPSFVSSRLRGEPPFSPIPRQQSGQIVLNRAKSRYPLRAWRPQRTRSRLTLDHGGSRWITVDNASFFLRDRPEPLQAATSDPASLCPTFYSCATSSKSHSSVCSHRRAVVNATSLC